MNVYVWLILIIAIAISIVATILITENRICCEIYGLGSYMEKVNVRYSWSPPDLCNFPEDLVGGGREIVEDELCK